jgi:hypothetical protein
MFLCFFLLDLMAMLRVFCDLILLLEWQGRESLVRVSSSRERESCNTIRTVFCVESERQTQTQREGVCFQWNFQLMRVWRHHEDEAAKVFKSEVKVCFDILGNRRNWRAVYYSVSP